MSKALDLSSAAARVAPNLLKASVILPDVTISRSAVEQGLIGWYTPGS